MSLPPWPLKLSSVQRKVEYALQVQYEVKKPSGSTFWVQAINVFKAVEEESEDPVEVDESLYDQVRLITRKQWLLQKFWEREVQLKSKPNLGQDLVDLLVWYILYYEKVLDALLLNDPQDPGPMKKWIQIEWTSPNMHTPNVVELLDGKLDNKPDVKLMISEDPWGLSIIMGYQRLSRAPKRVVELVLDWMVRWLQEHGSKEKALEKKHKKQKEENEGKEGKGEEGGETEEEGGKSKGKRMARDNDKKHKEEWSGTSRAKRQWRPWRIVKENSDEKEGKEENRGEETPEEGRVSMSKGKGRMMEVAKGKDDGEEVEVAF